MAVEQLRPVPKQVTIPLKAWQCYRCGHQWIPRVPGYEAKTCPRCKSPFWMSPRRNVRRRAKP